MLSSMPGNLDVTVYVLKGVTVFRNSRYQLRRGLAIFENYFTIISCFLYLISMPFNSKSINQEKMSVFLKISETLLFNAQNNVGQKWRNFLEVTKFMSDVKFSPAKKYVLGKIMLKTKFQKWSKIHLVSLGH